MNNLAKFIIICLCLVTIVVILVQILRKKQTELFCSSVVSFEDQTSKVGLQNPFVRLLKYGGATVGDLNGDGYPDFILGNHDDPASIYFNSANSSNLQFVRSEWSIHVDAHGFNMFHLSPMSKGMHFTVSRGGAKGTKPNFPFLFEVKSNNSISRLRAEMIFNNARGRGRTILPIHLSSSPEKFKILPDLLVMNARFPSFTNRHNQLLRSDSLNLEKLKLDKNLNPHLAKDTNHYATVTDYNNNGKMDVLTFHRLRLYARGNKDYELFNVTNTVFPEQFRSIPGVRTVIELDFDNDGNWDLYICRTSTNDLKIWRENNKDVILQNHLLRNVGGKYVDVTSSVGLPSGFQGTGATAGDFNNDGFIDILVLQEYGNDVLFLNSANGTFTELKLRWGGRKAQGDQPVSVDLDLDGQLDLVVSEGDWFDKGKTGVYRIMRNIAPSDQKCRENKNWLLVQVKNAPGYSATSLHAVVTVCSVVGEKELCMNRRVGSPGTAVSNSYIETVHFGLGNASQIKSVTIKWINGLKITTTNITVNSRITLGV